VIGHSEGGAVALALVNHPGNAPAPAGLALIEPSYSHILDVVSRQLGDQIDGGVQDGVTTAPDAATLTDWMNDGVVEIRSSNAPYPAPGPVPLPGATDFTADMQSTIAENIYGSDPSQMVLTHSFRTRYGKEFDALSPPALAAPVRIPTLITCGTKDFNTPCTPGGGPGSGESALAASFAPGVADFVVLANTVHIMRDVGADDPTSLAEQATYPFSGTLARAFSFFARSFVSIAPTPLVIVPSFTG
jgi:pimeloyl-ACP methyl ester carboxylesterase